MALICDELVCNNVMFFVSSKDKKKPNFIGKFPKLKIVHTFCFGCLVC